MQFVFCIPLNNKSLQVVVIKYGGTLQLQDENYFMSNALLGWFIIDDVNLLHSSIIFDVGFFQMSFLV